LIFGFVSHFACPAIGDIRISDLSYCVSGSREIAHIMQVIAGTLH
jgi:hypothetical protein